MIDDQESADEGHMSLGAGSALATQPGAARFANDPAGFAPDEGQEGPSFGVLETARSLGLPADVIDGVGRWFKGEVTLSESQLQEIDNAGQAEALTSLRELWGDATSANLTRISRYLETLPGGAVAAFGSARDAGGRALGNDAATLVRLYGAAKARGDIDLSGSADAQIAAIEQHMRNDRAAYMRDEPLQARYRALLSTKRARA